MPKVLQIGKRQRVLLRSMMAAQDQGLVNYQPDPSGSGAQSAATAGPDVFDRQRAWLLRMEAMARTATKLTGSSVKALNDSLNMGIDGVLLNLNIVTQQHGLENVFDNKCLSLEILRCLATSPEPGLPMPPRLFLGTPKSAMFGEEGFELEGFMAHVAKAPNCFISDSIIRLHNVDDPKKHQFRNCHELLWRNGFRNHLVKRMPCASLAQLSCAILG